MNFYKRHVGDIVKATMHLSQGEMGAYDLLLDWIYANEKALPHDLGALHRIGRASSKQECTNVDRVVAEFFQETTDGYIQKRASEEIAKASERSDSARRSAQARWDKSHSDCDAKRMRNASETQCVRNASQTPDSISQEQDQKTLSVSATPKPDDVPAEAILAGYRELLPDLPQPRKLDPDRKKKIIARWREDRERQSLDWWRNFWGYVAQSDFLTGRDGKWQSCNLDWLLEPKNMRKVTEGNYENRGNA